MDQITQLYDPTGTDHVFDLDAQQIGLSQSESHRILQQLTASLDLHKLASTYYTVLKSKLQLVSVTIKFESGSLTIGDSSSTGNVKTLDLVSQHSVFASISYSFTKLLTLKQSVSLNEIHQHFKHPLKNALEFYALKQMAMKDHLTSLGNRANYQETLQRMISQAKRCYETFGLLVIDLDRFKNVNDSYGHHEGDNVIMAMADVLRKSLRDTDYAFRFGGDEFCCLLPGSDNTINGAIAQRIQEEMLANTVLAKHNLSCSIGVTNYQTGDTEQSLFSRADTALYSAKQSGRSCFKAA